MSDISRQLKILAKELNIHYVAPQVWAWKKKRARTTAKAVTRRIIRLKNSFIGGRNITKDEVAPTKPPKTILRYLAFSERNFLTDNNSIKSIMKFTQNSMSMYITLCKKSPPTVFIISQSGAEFMSYFRTQTITFLFCLYLFCNEHRQS